MSWSGFSFCGRGSALLMRHDEFRLGDHFTTGPFLFRCTDVGSRTICAIRIDELALDGVSHSADGSPERIARRLVDPRVEDSSWLSGPPYAVAELCFDEDDQLACEFVADPDSWSAPKSF